MEKMCLLEWTRTQLFADNLPIWVRESRNGWLVGKSTITKLSRGMVSAELKSCLQNEVVDVRVIDGVCNVWVESVFSPSYWREGK